MKTNRSLALLLLAAGVYFPSINSAQAVTLTFDDLTTGTGSSMSSNPAESSPPYVYDIENSNYGGFTWGSIYLIWYQWIDAEHPVSGYENGVVSGEYIAWKNDNFAGTLSSNFGLFDFNSVYLTAAWTNDLHVTVEGYSGGLDGTLLYSNTVIVDTTGPTLFQFDYKSIDALKFITFGGTNAGLGGGGDQVVIDNLSYNPMPVPAAAWLFSSGLTGLIGVTRRKA